MVIGFTVHDPRLRLVSMLREREFAPEYCLYSFPPKNAKVEIEGGTTLSPSLTVFPSATLAESELWSEDVRTVLRKPRYRKQDIDRRRSKACSRTLNHAYTADDLTEFGAGHTP